MAAVGAVFLFLAAVGAVVLRFRADNALTATGAPSTLRTLPQNKKVGGAVIFAILFIFLLVFVIAPYGWVVEVLPGLLAIAASIALVAMAVERGSSLDNRIRPYVWGYTRFETDPAEEPRLDPSNPAIYDTRLVFGHADFDPDFARSEGLVIDEGKPLGPIVFTGSLAGILLYALITLLLATLMGAVSLGSFSASEPTPPGPTAPAQAPEPKPSDSDPTPEPSDTSSAAPETSKPAGKGKKPVNTTACDKGAVIAWLLPVPSQDRKQSTFQTKSVDRCVNGEWVMWTGESPQLVEVLNTGTAELVNLDKKKERFQLYHFKWNGEDVLIRVPTDLKR